MQTLGAVVQRAKTDHALTYRGDTFLGAAHATAYVHARVLTATATNQWALRARDGHKPVQRRLSVRKERLSGVAVLPQPCLLWGGPEETLAHMHVGCVHSRPHYRQAVRKAARHLQPGDKALWVASWRSAGAAWTEILCTGLVPEAAEAQLCAIARYDLPGGTRVDHFLQDTLRMGNSAWELPNLPLEYLLREPLSAAAWLHQWLTVAGGSSPPPSPAPWQGLRSFPLCLEWHPGVPAARGPQPVPGPAGRFLEAPTRRPLPASDHRARLHDRMGGPYSGRGVGAQMGLVVRRHARPGDQPTTVRRRPARGVGAGHPATAHHDLRGGPQPPLGRSGRGMATGGPGATIGVCQGCVLAHLSAHPPPASPSTAPT